MVTGGWVGVGGRVSVWVEQGAGSAFALHLARQRARRMCCGDEGKLLLLGPVHCAIAPTRVLVNQAFTPGRQHTIHMNAPPHSTPRAHGAAAPPTPTQPPPPSPPPQVSLHCGPAEELTHVEEPSRCEYHAQLATPAACSAEALQALKERLAAKQALLDAPPAGRDEL